MCFYQWKYKRFVTSFDFFIKCLFSSTEIIALNKKEARL
ncbi:hypothetical protein I602_748 [Polaribacter dokdonensis DSW-5]|uniref:Uncharacterized protein n=1 Tax=Polaribacter dokdonensis DSW-5 TaxID=1300348 RepID=A0A0N0CF23_9FLAO|nr:hypothetical protein I602_748 [Polaribacter dokdonensis DSW-5]